MLRKTLTAGCHSGCSRVSVTNASVNRATLSIVNSRNFTVYKSKHFTRNERRKAQAWEMALDRHQRMIAETAAQAQEFDEDGGCEELTFAHDLRRAHRSKLRQKWDDQPITDEEWFDRKMDALNTYNLNRRRWKRYLRSTSLSPRLICEMINRIPNNQAPLTAFWMKKNMDYLERNFKVLDRYGMTHAHRKQYFRRYRRSHIHREWPADMAIRKEYQKRVREQRRLEKMMMNEDNNSEDNQKQIEENEPSMKDSQLLDSL